MRVATHRASLGCVLVASWRADAIEAFNRMSDAPFTNLSGSWGRRYRYWIYQLRTSLDRGPGNFLFPQGGSRRWRPIYFGQAENSQTTE